MNFLFQQFTLTIMNILRVNRGDKYLYTFIYVKYKQKYTKICPFVHTLYFTWYWSNPFNLTIIKTFFWKISGLHADLHKIQFESISPDRDQCIILFPTHTSLYPPCSCPDTVLVSEHGQLQWTHVHIMSSYTGILVS